MLANLLRAAASVALTPVAVVVDVVTLPVTAYNGWHPFGETVSLLRVARRCVAEAVKPSKD